ncbi:MAG: transglycosylase SLT domain-containing protein [Candidatus Latescibacterota bacterium]
MVAAAAPADTLFPRPAELRPNIEFWKGVFAVFDTNEVIVHDAEHLGVIYGVESLSRGPGRRASEQAIRDRYARALARLAQGPVDTLALGPEERRVWLAHGRSLDPECYRRAADRLRLQVGQRSRMVRGLGTWRRHRGEMERIFRQHGLPDSLVFLPFVESGFNAQARSTAGAVGLWQITRPAARRLLRMDRRVDERRDPLRATGAAATILGHNHRTLGSWPLAITAYNHGLGGVARGVRTVSSTNIADLVHRYRGKAFGFASRNFYAEFLAILEVMGQYPVYYGEDGPHLAVVPAGRLAEERVARLERGGLAARSGPTLVRYALDRPRLVQLDIYDVRGQRVRSLARQVQGPGSYQAAWDGLDEQDLTASTGVYLARLQAGNQVEYGKLVLLR